MTKRSRRFIWLVAIVGALGAGLYFGSSAVLSPLIRSRLQKMVSAHLNAELRMGTVRYHFPYGVSLSDASLVTTAPDGQSLELLKIKRVELQLAELPIGDGPLVIEKLAVREPSLHLIRMPDGIVGQKTLIRREPTTGPSTGARVVAIADKLHQEKLSDIFRLKRFAVDSGQVVFEDRTKAGTVPMVWKDLTTDLNLTMRSGALYAYNVTAKNPPLAEMAASGTMDIDELVLVVKNFALKLEVSPDSQQSQLPGPLQDLFRVHQVDGLLRFSGEATVPLQSPSQTTYNARLDLARASGELPQWDASLNRLRLALRITSEAPAETLATGSVKVAQQLALASAEAIPGSAIHAIATGPSARPVFTPPMYLHVETMEVGSGDTLLRLDRGTVVIDPGDRTWRVRDLLGSLAIGKDYRSLPTGLQQLFEKINARGKLEFTATAGGPVKPPPGVRPIDAITYELLAQSRDTSVQPPGFPHPIEKLSGTLHLSPGLIRLENLQARYGADSLFVVNARIPLKDVRREIRLEEIVGSIEFADDSPRYPRPLDGIFEAIHPAGMYLVGGYCVIRPDAPKEDRVDYQIDIDSDRGRLAPTPHHLPLTDVKCNVRVKPGEALIQRFQSEAMGGRLVGDGQIKWGRADVVTYQAKVQAASIDLKQFAERYADPNQQPMRLSGKGFADALVSGTGPKDERTAADNVAAKGEFEILEGNFWELPVLKEIAGGTKVAKEALTVGQAAGTFDLFQQKVTLDQFAISAPVLGLQGSGWVRFDGQLEAKVVAAPLADWRDKIRSTGIPILSDAAGVVAGGVQKLLNSATSNLLYEFRVTGTAAKPEITTVPAPVLTDAAAGLFGRMLNPARQEHLIDELKQTGSKQVKP